MKLRWALLKVEKAPVWCKSTKYSKYYIPNYLPGCVWWTQLMPVCFFSYLKCAVTQLFHPVHTVVFERSKHHGSVLRLHTKGWHVVLRAEYTQSFPYSLQLLSCLPSSRMYELHRLDICVGARRKSVAMTDLNGLWHPYGVIVEELEETVATVVIWHTWTRAQALTMGQASAFGGSLTTLRSSDSRITLSFLSKWCWWCLLIPTLWSPPAPPPLGSKQTSGVTKWP